MDTQATVTRGPLEGGLEINETSWIHGLGATGSRNTKAALLIGICGELSYEHLMELWSYVRRYWKPESEHLVLDFTHLASADQDGMVYLMSYLYRAATESAGDIYLVRAPFEASAFLRRMWGSPKIHFGESVGEVIEQLK